MAAHRKHRKPRKPRQYPFTGQAARTATTIALAGAATATAFNGTGQAEPTLTPAQIKAKVDKLYQEAEATTERYNETKEESAREQESLNRLRDEAARRTDRLNASRNALGSIATAQYRAGTMDPAVRLALTSAPDEYLNRASVAERVGDRQSAAVSGVRRQLVEIAQVRARAEERMADLGDQRAELARHRATISRKLTSAEGLLRRLTAAQRADYRAAGTDRGGSPSAHRVQAPNARAAQAVSYAHGAIGKPYVWGATGPGAYDCSGLTQAAWKAAGVSLPRTSYAQINAGQRVGRSELAPGDLVFFFEGVSHVGLYIGDGRMIHAPRPGAPIRIAPVDQMPFAGATRPA
ncbi:NlpC/P60 family protein [Streptomyces sp. NPDC020965]|uniref:C40 family peptidase n=1 Tax=Streptomyces sp. NPDC020965 TaxID=3365105 RepID=UPI003791B2AB